MPDKEDNTCLLVAKKSAREDGHGVQEVEKGEKKGLEDRERWEGPFQKNIAKATHFYSPFETALPGLHSLLQLGRGTKKRNEAC